MKKYNTVREDIFQQQVIELAKYFGWRVAHFRSVRVMRKNGTYYYQTPVQADGAGWPDLVLAHRDKGRTIYAELKSETGKVSEAQQEWLEVLAANPGNDVFTWRPSDWEEIQEALAVGVSKNLIER